jgi:hypothetical protein
MPYDAGMAIDTNGNVWGWGFNLENPLCITQGNLLTPTELPLKNVTMASGAGWHAIYLSGGVLYACGGNAGGELGNGTTVASKTPVQVIGLPAEPIRTLVTSWEDSGVLLADGSFYDWGYNAADQLGNGTTTDSDVPVHVPLPDTVAQVSMGGSAEDNGQTEALLSNGSLWSWGSDQFGQLGDGTVSPSSAPVQVDVPKGVSFVQMSSGGSTMYAIDSAGAAWSWGENNLGQLGVGSAPYSDVPIQIGIDLSFVSSTAFGDAPFYGSLDSLGVHVDDVVGIVADPATGGYWLVGSDGTVWNLHAPDLDVLPALGTSVSNIVGGASTPDGQGLYLVGANGQVYNLLGDGHLQGDASSLALNAPILGMTVDPQTGGYWLLAKDGGVFSFGAPFFGSTGGLRLNKPVVAMAATPDGGGYRLVAADGGTFDFGDALFEGSLPGSGVAVTNIVGAVPTA